MTFFVAGASLVSGFMGSRSANRAADSQAQGTANALAETRRQYDQTREDYTPYREAGVRALGQYEQEMGRQPTAQEVMNGAGYQFGLQQGQQGIDRRIAASGGRVSGAAIKAAGEYATNYATTGYNAEYQRRQDRLNRLAAAAGLGQTATAGSAAAGTAASSNLSGLYTNQGNASGQAALAQGNIWGNTVNQLGAIGQRWAQQPSTNSGGIKQSWDTTNQEF